MTQTATSLSLAGFLRQHAAAIHRIQKPVPIGAIPALTAESDRTILFERVEGSDMPVVDLLFVDRAAQARVLGCAPSEVVRTLVRIMKQGPKPLHVVDDAPCKAHKYLGSDVDLTKLPIITHTAQDPYPYTTGFVTHRDPFNGGYNAMFPRCGVLGPREMVTSYVTPTALRFLAHHRQIGEPMPQAIAIGVHPAWELAATYVLPHEGWLELELFEGITGRPGEVVKCETVDLVVPADASIVVEGWVHPTRTALDGPSPGPSMLFTPESSQQPVFEVTAITMRDDPVYRNHLETPFTDHQELPRLWQEAAIYDRLASVGLPIRDVAYLNGGGALMVVLQMEPTAEGQVTDALLSAMSAFLNNKLVVAVDPDVDVYDYRDVMFALATRVDPGRDVLIVPNTRGWLFDPTARPIVEAGPNAKASRLPAVGARWGIDATKPPAYRPERRDYERAWPLGWGEVHLKDFLE